MRFILALLLVLSSCFARQPAADPVSVLSERESACSVMEHKGFLVVKLDPRFLPKEAAFVEIWYDGSLQGIYLPGDDIYLPYREGCGVLSAVPLDIDGNRTFGRLEYDVEVPGM